MSLSTKLHVNWSDIQRIVAKSTFCENFQTLMKIGDLSDFFIFEDICIWKMYFLSKFLENVTKNKEVTDKLNLHFFYLLE